MKTSKKFLSNLISLALLSAVAGSAMAAPAYSYRIRVDGAKRNVAAPPTNPGAITNPGGTPLATGNEPLVGGNEPLGGGTEPLVGGDVFNDGGVNSGLPIDAVVPAENETAYFSMTKSAVSRYSATITVKNTSTQPIYGPLSLMFKDMPASVTLQNANGTYGAMPFIYLTTDGVNPILPGQQFTVNATFANSQNVPASFNNLVYSGFVDTSGNVGSGMGGSTGGVILH
jgi:hypothetical protein